MSIRSISKKILHSLLLNRISWKLLQPFRFLNNRLIAAKKFYDTASETAILQSTADSIFNDRTVRHGPFKGMKYNNSASGSSVYAKLLGSYESEIHDFLNQATSRKPGLILNIGCDEGYYAVGLALKTGAKVIAFDTNKTALKNTEALARLNEVEDLISFRGHCDSNEILQINYTDRMLIIADCEGDEKKIFTKETAEKLKLADLIIELHLHIHPEISGYLESIFFETHFIKIANSIDDHLKALNYNYPEVQGLSYHQKRFIVEERDLFMQWIYLQAKA